MTLSVTTVPTSVNTSPALSPKIIAHGYKATPPALKPEPTVPTSVNTLPAPSPKIIAHGYKATPSALKPATTSLALKHKNSEVLGTRLSKRTLFKDQRSLRTGAASLLGGSLSISSQKFGSGYLAALPNSNRRNHQTPDSIDARSQDTDIASYLDQLQQGEADAPCGRFANPHRRTLCVEHENF